jgi:lipopolysaccharide export system permease protein
LKRLDWYVLREVFLPFLIGFFVVILLFQINTYMYMAKTFNLENVPLRAVLQYILFRTPEFMKMTLPVAVALGASLGVTRIARESELTAMRAAGIRVMRVLRPILLCGILAGALNWFVVDRIMPVATKRAADVAYAAAIVGLTGAASRTNALISLGPYTASIAYLTKEGENVLRMRDVLLFHRPLGTEDSVELIRAKTGRYDRGIWEFLDADQWTITGTDLTYKTAQRITVNEKIVINSLFSTNQPEEVSTAELAQIIESKRKLRQSTRADEIEYHSRFSVPVACVVFAVVSSGFAILFAPKGGFTGLLVSFVAVLLYYNAFVVSTQIIGKFPEVPPALAAWLPNILFGLIGIWVLRKLE